MRMTRAMKEQKVPVTHNPACADVSHWNLEQQLTLSRAQCQYLHRELANARLQAPMAPPDVTPDEALRLEVEHLRQRLGTLTLHYEQAQQDIAHLTWSMGFAYKALGWEPDRLTLLKEDSAVVEQVFKILLTLAHPDRWSQGQPATELAHELAVAINAQREKLTSG